MSHDELFKIFREIYILFVQEHNQRYILLKTNPNDIRLISSHCLPQILYIRRLK